MKHTTMLKQIFFYSACMLLSYAAFSQKTNPLPRTNIPVIKPVGQYNDTLQKLSTDFYVPPRVGSGDKDFGGNGPRVTCSVNLSISADHRQIIAHITMNAKETKSDWTECSGSIDKVIFTCRAGQGVNRIIGPVDSRCSYVDNDHEDDFVQGYGNIETPIMAQNSDWYLPGLNTSDLVAFYRFCGDVDGDDAGTKTGVQIFFNPIIAQFSGSPMDEVQLGVPTGFGTCGKNTCGSSASTAFLKYYGTPGLVSCEHFKTLYTSMSYSPNVASFFHQETGENIGVDPNTVRDRLKEYRSATTLEEVNNSSVTGRIKTLLSSNKPLIVLIGWGSKTVRDFYCRSDDNVSLNPNSVLHYVVIDGVNRQTGVFSVVDNGSRTYMSEEYLRNVILWHPENFVIEGALYGAQTKPGKFIY